MFSSPRNLIPEILTKISTIEGEGSRDEPKNSGWGKGKLCTRFFFDTSPLHKFFCIGNYTTSS